LRLKIATDESRVNQKKDFEFVSKYLDEVGIHIEEEVQTHEEFIQRNKREGRPYIYATGWYADYPDPDNFVYVLFNSKAGDILGTGYKSSRLDELSEKARRSLDLDERIELYREAEDLLVEDAPVLLLYHERAVVPHSKEVMGLKLFLVPPTVRPESVWLKS